jgi:hypothetical protein
MPQIKQSASSGLKRKFTFLLFLTVLGGASYIAYQQGAIDRYLPNALRAVPPEPVVAQPSEPVAVVSAPLVVAPVVAPDAAVTASPILISVNGAQAHALFGVYDAQWQWRTIEQDFLAHGDSAAALQNIRLLQAQLNAVSVPALAPVLASVGQVEAQLKRWQPLQAAGYLDAIAQAQVRVRDMDVRASKEQDISLAVSGSESGWQRFLASLKNVVEIKRVDEQKERAALSQAAAVVVKQAINAEMSAALSSAQSGRWAQAQAHVRSAQSMAAQWSDVQPFDGLAPFIAQSEFPALPDFAAVHTALSQARTQLLSEARTAQAAQIIAPIAPSATTQPDAVRVNGGL